MKNIISFLTIIIATFSLTSCEDPVKVDLNTAPPKLVIDANIKWTKLTTGNLQTIKLTTTTSYYDTVIPTVSGATVFITNSANTVFNFIETPNTGNYVSNDFVPVVNETYTLTVVHNGETYTATEKLYATPDISRIEQENFSGFGGDQVQVKFFYQDNGSENNFYLIGFKSNKVAFPEYGVLKDEFFQGNEMFGFYTDEDLKPGDDLGISLQGISQRYFNYMNKLLNIAGTNGGNPFATAPGTLRGNITNQTNTENYPLGYFNLAETDTDTYIIQ